MAETHKDSQIKQRDFMNFLEESLVVCTVLKEEYDLKHRPVMFREFGADGEWADTRDENWGRRLFYDMYRCIQTGTKKLEITSLETREPERVISIDSRFQIDMSEQKMQDWKEFKNKFDRQLCNLTNRFVNEDAVEHLKRCSDNFFISRERVWEQECVFGLENEEIAEYLNSYYELLGSFVTYYTELEAGERNPLIQELLCADAVFDERAGIYNISFWSPIVLAKLQKVIKGVEKYYQLITDEQEAVSKGMQVLCQHTLLVKAQNIFRWYMPGGKRVLFHAAIASYVENKNYNLKFQINARNIKTYNSYEGIGEPRLGEKIIYEYNLSKKNSTSDFMVAIMGDLSSQPLEELYRYVTEKIYRDSSVRPAIAFHIYTKNELELGTDAVIDNRIKYCGKPSEVLLEKDRLGNLIDTHNIVFILDCIELYKSTTAIMRENIGFMRQRYTFGNYGEYYLSNLKENDICDSNALEELYEVLTGECCYGRLGKIEKYANEQLLDFCEKRINAARGTEEKAVYVYVSDLKAFENIYNDDQYYIRTERYNQKEIGIIRYSTENIEVLPMGRNEEKILVFTTWQFVKYAAFDKRGNLAGILGADEEDYLDYDSIFIGMDYTDWPRQIQLHYYISDDGENYNRCLLAIRLIDDVLIPVLNSKKDDMFNTYIRKAIQSFFYSVAKNVNDMLFIHLFQDKSELLGRVTRAKENDAEAVRKNINRKFKYSSKRFYDMVMKNYDMWSDSYIGQYKTSQIIMNNELHNHLISKRDIYRNIINACHNLSYENSCLERNCEKEL